MARLPFVRSALAALTLVVIVSAAPAAAQEYIWTADRPDGVAPAGIVGDRVLPVGALEIKPTFQSYDFLGTRFGSQFISFRDLFQFFEFAPFAMSSDVFTANVSYGVTEELTVLGRLGYASHTRELISENDEFLLLENSGLTDAEVHALYELYRMGAWRAHVSGGISIPLGSVDAEDDEATFRSGPLPYDMQNGSGVIGFIPGATIQTMNEYGSVGLQLLARIFVGENSRGWRSGNAMDANLWAQYRVNRFISVNSGLRATARNAIQGFDVDLDPQRDPGELPTSIAGERVDIPLGLNLRMPEGPLSGHRLGVEFLFNVHEDLDGPWLAADQGFTLSWTMTF